MNCPFAPVYQHTYLQTLYAFCIGNFQSGPSPTKHQASNDDCISFLNHWPTATCQLINCSTHKTLRFRPSDKQGSAQTTLIYGYNSQIYCSTSKNSPGLVHFLPAAFPSPENPTSTIPDDLTELLQPQYFSRPFISKAHILCKQKDADFRTIQTFSKHNPITMVRQNL